MSNNTSGSNGGSGEELHVVLGGTGGVGGAVVRELVARGKRVRAVTRSGRMEAPERVETVAGDVSHLDDARRVCEGAAVVYFCSNPPYTRWPQEFPPMLDGAIEGASAAGAKLIAAGNLYVYAPPTQPLTEDLPWAPTTRKGAVRKRMDETLLAAHRSGRVRAAIGRASDFYGPGALNSTTAGDRFFAAYLAGKPVQWIGRLDMPHSYSYIEDFGRGLVTLGEREEALGQAWHIPAAAPLTGREFLDLMGEIGGAPVRVQRVPSLMLRALGLISPIVHEVVEMQFEFDAPFIMDGTKYTRAFGGTPTPHSEALRRTYDWFSAWFQRRQAAGR